jgi:acyl-CoA reductase-like NAD-dependent aldehyde dehydrogenase
MVPMWTLPIAIALGNTMIIKPSEKVPLTMSFTMELLKEAGLPDGVVNLIHGTQLAVNKLIDHPHVKAVTFVGTSRVANLLSQRCHALGKRIVALGGAKNHLVASPDCDVEMTSNDIVNSFVGCSGQRCMAASVLLTVGEQPNLIKKVIEKASEFKAGQGVKQMGPVIDEYSRDKIIRYISESESSGAKILLDGRDWLKNHDLSSSGGYWIGPTVILHNNLDDKALSDEIFGPVISVLQVNSKEEAIEIENKNPYGNAGNSI